MDTCGKRIRDSDSRIVTPQNKVFLSTEMQIVESLSLMFEHNIMNRCLFFMVPRNLTSLNGLKQIEFLVTSSITN